MGAHHSSSSSSSSPDRCCRPLSSPSNKKQPMAVGGHDDDSDVVSSSPATLVTLEEEEEEQFPVRRRRFVERSSSVPPHESVRQLLKLHIQSQLRFAGPDVAVKLPRGACEKMWIDAHVVDLVNDASTAWNMVSCTCEEMSAGSRRTYGEHTAQKYAEDTFAEAKRIVDEDFPLDEESYPPHFKDLVKQICTKLLHLYAHIFHSHFSYVVALRYDQIVNQFFKRFVFFVVEFDLVEPSELQPLDELIRTTLRTSNNKQCNKSSLEEGNEERRSHSV